MSEASRFAYLKPLLIIIALVLLTLPAIQPFLRGDMSHTDDGYLHLYRAVALDHSLRHDGSLYPRYSSGLVYGYGAALFNYFPPSTYYPTVFLHWAGLSFVEAWVGTLILFVWIAAFGAFLLGKEWAGDTGGFITAAAYVYAPYLLFDTVIRGTSSEMGGLVLLPWVMWGFTRLAFYGQRRDFAAAVLTFALFIPMHNLVTLHGTVMLAGYCAYLWLSSPQKIRVFSQLLIAAIIAVIMTAFFWLPALGETEYTKIDAVASNLSSIDVTRSLRPLSEVFAFPRTADPTQLQPPIPIVLGWVQIILGVIGTGLAWQKRTRKIVSLQIVLWLIVIIVVFLQLPVSAIVWEKVPLIGYSQFAWRTMGLPSLALALLAGIGGALIIDRMQTQSLKTVALCVFLVMMVLYGIPYLYTTYTPVAANSIVDAQDFERRTGALTISSYSEYLPNWTDESTLDSQKLIPAFAANEVIPRLTPPEGVSVVDAQWQATSAVIELEAVSPSTLVFDWLYVPGWQARFLDEATALVPLTVHPNQPEGFVTVDIPAGTHTLEIALHDTRLQSIAEGVSIAAVGILGLTLLVGWRVWKPSDENLPVYRAQHIAPLRMCLLVIGVGLALFLLKTLVIDRIDSPFKRARLVNGQITNVETAFNTDYGGKIRLLGVELPDSIKSGESGAIRVFWTLADEILDTDYATVVYLRDSQQNIIAEDGSFYPGNLATSNWLPNYYLEEVIDFAIPMFTPPGTYTLDIGFYNPETQQHLDVLNEVGNPVDVKVVLGSVEITQPDSQSNDLPETIGSIAGFDLLAIEGIPETAQVGDEMTVRWLWHKVENVESDVQAQLVWLNDNGEIESSTPLVPLTLDYPTKSWQTGAAWRATHRLYVPGILFAGDYTVAITVGDIHIPITEMNITRPPRQEYAPPNIEHAGTIWENRITLIGYDYTVTAVTLYWETVTQINKSYRLFAQVVDSHNTIIALTDEIPVNWTRPTTSWAIGEVITTQHDFGALPAGEYRIRIGWYDPITGNRIPVSTGEDSTFLPLPFVVE
jgi:hypothetical protein